MRDSRRLILALLFAITAVSCSRNSSTPAHVTVIGAFATGNSTNMLFGRHSTGKRVAKKFDAAGQFSILLENGTWEFAFVTWDGANPYEGNAKCYAGSATLSGAPVTIEAALSLGGCSAAIFGGVDTTPAASGSNLKPLSFFNCSTVGNVSNIGSACPGLDRGFNRSFTVAFAEYNEFVSETRSSAYTSVCINTPSTDGITNTNLKIPHGDANSVFGLIVTAYANANCAGPADSSFISRGLQDVAAETYTFVTDSTKLVTYFQDQGYLDEVTILSSNLSTPSGVSYRPITILPTTPTSTYVYSEGDWKNQLQYSDLTSFNVFDVFSSPTNAVYSLRHLSRQGSVAYFGADEVAANIFDLYSFDGTSTTNLTGFTGTTCGVTSDNGIFTTNSAVYFIKEDCPSGTTKSVCRFNGSMDCSFTVGTTGTRAIGVHNSSFYYLSFVSGNWKLYQLAASGSAIFKLDLPNSAVTDVRFNFERAGKFFAVIQAATSPANYLLNLTDNVVTHTGLPDLSTKLYTTSDGNICFAVKNPSDEYPAYIDSSGVLQIVATGTPGANSVRVFGEVAGKLVFSIDRDASVGFNDDLMVVNVSSPATAIEIYNQTLPVDYTPSNFVISNDKLIFRGNDGTNGNEPWVYTGTGNASMLADINIGANNSSPTSYYDAGDKAYFQADDGSATNLWVTDGTVGGTSNIKPSVVVSAPLMIHTDNYLYFIGEESSVRRFYRTDGIVNGTVIIDDATTENYLSVVFPWEDRAHIQLGESSNFINHFFIQSVL